MADLLVTSSEPYCQTMKMSRNLWSYHKSQREKLRGRVSIRNERALGLSRTLVYRVLLILVVCAPGISISQNSVVTARHGRLLLQNMYFPKDARITSIDIHLAPAVIESASEIPPYWKVTIDNEPGWQSEFIAEATVESGGMVQERLNQIEILMNVYPKGKATFDAWGSYTITSPSLGSRKIPLDYANFSFEDRFIRRRLN
jgi:hypothetical protein